MVNAIDALFVDGELAIDKRAIGDEHAIDGQRNR